jgi:transcriptional regulator with XRE-family HTH domain
MANEDRRTLGEIIRDARVAADIGLRDLAKKLNMSPSYLSDIENDRRVPAEEVMQGIGTALGLDATELMARAGRFGQEAERYMKQHPTAGVLFRRMSDKGITEERLKQWLKEIDEAPSKRKP